MSNPNLNSVEALFAPLQTVSNIAADKAKKLASLQLSSLEAYFTASINQARAVVAANGPQDFQALAAKQAELVKLLSEKAIGDMQQMVLLGTEFGNEMQKAFDKSAATPAATAN